MLKIPDPSLLRQPNIPIPLHGLAPREILGRKWWDETRKATYARGWYRCWACGVHKSQAILRKWLEAHEMYEYRWEEHTLVFQGTMALCHACHNFIHSGRMQKMLEIGKLSRRVYGLIVAHGKGVLGRAGLEPYNDYPESFLADWRAGHAATWGKWKMVINGKEHYSPYKDLDEYEEAYRKENKK